jgi:hypothetical protein
MKFNMKDLNPGSWFKFDEDDPESGRICIRILNAAKLAEIRDTTVKTKVEYVKGDRHEFKNIDDAARDSIIWDYCIVNWEDLIDDDDSPIECTTENKIKLMTEHVGFQSFVENCMVRLNKEADTFAEYSEKNLSSTPGPD